MPLQGFMQIPMAFVNEAKHDVKHTQGNASTLILAVVAPDQRKPTKRHIDDKVKHKEIRKFRPIILTSQVNLFLCNAPSL